MTERVDRVADQVGGGDDPGAQHDDEEVDHLLLGERTRLHEPVDEPADRRLLRLGDAPGEVAAELLGGLDELGGAVALRVEHAGDAGERPDPEVVAPVGLHAEEVAHHGHREQVAEVGGDVDPPGVGEAIEDLRGRGHDRGVEPADRPRREVGLDRSADPGVVGRIHVEHRQPGRLEHLRDRRLGIGQLGVAGRGRVLDEAQDRVGVEDPVPALVDVRDHALGPVLGDRRVRIDEEVRVAERDDGHEGPPSSRVPERRVSQYQDVDHRLILVPW